MTACFASCCALSTVLGCGDDGGMTETSGSTSTGDDPETTLPLTSVSISTDPSTSSTGASSDGSESSGASTGGSSDGSSGEPTTSSTGAPEDSSSSTGGPVAYEVGWCILQFPATIVASPGEVTAVYARVYVEGITDETNFVDEDRRVVSEFGFGADGSDPAMDDWTWLAGEPNPGWDGSMAGGFGQENNDEYQVDLSFPEAGVFDYAARFSADGGETWVYCDLDDSETGGYSPDQAGAATIAE